MSEIKSEIEKLKKESSDLAFKRCNLVNFIDSKAFDDLDSNHRFLLEAQSQAMGAYESILSARIESLEFDLTVEDMPF